MSNLDCGHAGSSRDRLKDEVVSLLTDAIVHDFRNLLFVFDANLDLVHRAPEVPASVQASVATMMQAAQEGKVLTDCLLSLSRRHDTSETPLERVPLHEVFPPLMSLARKLLPSTLQICYKAGDSLWVEVNTSDLLHAIFCLILHVRDAACQGILQVSFKSHSDTEATILFVTHPAICQAVSQDQSVRYFDNAEALVRSIGGTLTQAHAADTTTFSLALPVCQVG